MVIAGPPPTALEIRAQGVGADLRRRHEVTPTKVGLNAGWHGLLSDAQLCQLLSLRQECQMPIRRSNNSGFRQQRHAPKLR